MQLLLTTILSTLFALTATQDNRADVPEMVGNALIASASGVDTPGAIYILNEGFESDGVVFAFSAYFRYDTLVRLQIWRQADNNTMDSAVGEPFSLLGEVKVIPSVVQAREDVYIESRITEPCIRVRKGDRLGAYFEDAPGALAYSFDADHLNALGTTVAEPVGINNHTTFNNLVFPYDFSLAAYFLADKEQYNGTDEDSQFVECPRGMRIPSFNPITLSTTTTEPITGRPGVDGAIGPMGDMGATGPIGAIGATGFGATGAIGEMGPQGELGATGEIGATGEVGAMGLSGTVGATGQRGEQGDQGIQGPQGIPGPFATIEPIFAEVSDDNDEMTIVNIILLLWLIIVTILLVVLIIILICAYRRYKRKEGEKEPYSNRGYESDTFNYQSNGDGTKRDKDSVKYTTRVPSYLEGQPTWANTMKSIAESTYSNDTLDGSTHSTPKTEPKFTTANEVNASVVDNNVSDSHSHTGLVRQTPPIQEPPLTPQSPNTLNNQFAI